MFDSDYEFDATKDKYDAADLDENEYPDIEAEVIIEILFSWN